MHAPLRSRRGARAVAAVLAGALVAASAPARAAQADEPGPVQAPYWGEVLFQFWQQRWFPAITSLLVSRQFGRLAPHEDDSELLRGGLLLSYGQHQEAGDIFERLAAERPRQRDRAWLQLARVRHQRALPDAAEAALARIEQPLPAAQEETRVLLQSQLLLGRGQAGQAAQVLQPLADAPGATPYARYNRGIALLQGGQPQAGRTLLEALGREPAADEERRALRDKANLTLGFAALREDRPEDARAALQRVRLQGAQASKALLGDGWAALALQQPGQALVPWLELAGRDGADPAVLEARIAVPYAYAELGARQQAASRYEAAIDAMAQESQALADTVAALRDGRALEPLLAAAEARDLGDQPDGEALPPMAYRAQLAPMLAENDFQEALRSVLDLRWLMGNLRRWADALAAFDDMLSTRSRAYAERLPRLLALARDDAAGLQAGQRRRDALAAELARAEAEGDGQALASADELAMMQRLAAVRTALPQAGDDAPALAERARRVEGALRWRLAQQQPERLWALRRHMASIDAALAEAAGRQVALQQAQQDEPARFERLGLRIAALRERLATSAPRVAALEQEQRQALQDIAVAALTRTQERLAQYQTQARFALAQLQDGAEVVRASNREAEDGQPQ